MGNGKWGVGMMIWIWIWIWHTFSAFVFWPFIYAVAFFLLSKFLLSEDIPFCASRKLPACFV